MILPMGVAPKGPPPSVLSNGLFVRGVNVGGLLCGTSIESIGSKISIESIESAESSDSIESIESIQSIAPNKCGRLKILIFTFSIFKRS